MYQQPIQPEIMLMLVKQRQKELRAEAEMYHLIHEAHIQKDPIWPRLAWHMGTLLVAVGQRLMARPVCE